MLVQINQLLGPTLRYAVAKAMGFDFYIDSTSHPGEQRIIVKQDHIEPSRVIDWRPDEKPEQSWPIIVHNLISIHFCRDLRDVNGRYIHAESQYHLHHGYWRGDHSKPLVAALRCYLSMKYGEQILVPDHLTT